MKRKIAEKLGYDMIGDRLEIYAVKRGAKVPKGMKKGRRLRTLSRVLYPSPPIKSFPGGKPHIAAVAQW